MVDQVTSTSEIYAELAQLRQELRRSELRLAGARTQLERHVQLPTAPVGGDVEACIQRAERAEAELLALLNTKTMRTLRIPRVLYGALYRRFRNRPTG